MLHRTTIPQTNPPLQHSFGDIQLEFDTETDVVTIYLDPSDAYRGYKIPRSQLIGTLLHPRWNDYESEGLPAERYRSSYDEGYEAGRNSVWENLAAAIRKETG